MVSVTTDINYANGQSKDVLDKLSLKGETRLFKLEAEVNDTMIANAWNSFGAYIAKNIKSGRSVTIPGFGIMTFGAPYVKLEGVTNPEQRDLRQRTPVFLVSKEFVKGANLQIGIVSGGNIRPYSMKGVISGLPQAKINYTDIGYAIGLNKEGAKICIERVFKELAERTRLKRSAEMEIPNVGKFLVRGQIVAVDFDEFLVHDALDATNKTLQAKNTANEKSNLTIWNLKKFMNPSQFDNPYHNDDLRVDSSAQDWLKSHLDIDVSLLKTSVQRPQTTSSVLSRDRFQGKRNFDNKSIHSKTSSKTSNYSFASVRKSIPNDLLLEKTHFDILNHGRKKVKYLLKAQNLSPEEVFLIIVKTSFGAKATLNSKLTYPLFKKGILRIPSLKLEENEVDALIKNLDSNNEHVITFEKWNKVFGESRSYVAYVKEFIKNYNLEINDILKRMDLKKNSPPLDLETLQKKLKSIHPLFKESKVTKLCKELMKGREKIEIQEIIDAFSSPTIVNRAYQGIEKNDWYLKQLMSIKYRIKNLLKLRDAFEKLDEKGQGLIDPTSFKSVLANYNLGFSSEEMNRFSRNVEKDSNMMIDYVKWIEDIEKLKTQTELNQISTDNSQFEFEQETLINDVFKSYLISNKLQAKDFILKLSKENTNSVETNKVSIERFADFLLQICRESFIKKRNCISFAKKVDVDKDGFVSDNDLDTFATRFNYIKDGEKKMYNNSKNNVLLFPHQPLSEEKIEILLRDLRQTLVQKRISFYDFFKMIDLANTGFANINDFCIGVSKVMKLSQPILDGFFAYIDREKLGIISYEDFLNVLKRSIIDKPADVTQDSFDWEVDILNKIREYSLEKNLSAEDTFRILDYDFDGFVSKDDIFKFLGEVLSIPKDDLTPPRLNRLYKLMDVYKRGRVQLSDVKMILLSNEDKKVNNILSGGSATLQKSNYDWKLHARQQIGLLLSQQFKDLQTSFQVIAEKKDKIKYDQFYKWIENQRILIGFDMTQRLIQKLFADLDPHKKGYLNEADWHNAFQGYNVGQQILSEVKETLRANYENIESAFNFFLSHENSFNASNKVITYSGFKKAINALSHQRFDEGEIQFLWKKCVLPEEHLDFKRFAQRFDIKYPRTGQSFVASGTFQGFNSTSKPKTAVSVASRTFNNTLPKITKEEIQQTIFEKLRQILNASNVPIEKFFNSIDIDKSGDLSNLEFINAIKSLNLGLNLEEIENLLLFCDTNYDGKISFSEFMRKFSPQFVSNRLLSRAKLRLKKLKENIYSYMLSPKDAFLNFNEDRTGKMTFQQFNVLINKLSQLAREEVPPFPILKDLFDFIDIRKDGIIDLTEWMQSFRLIENNFVGFGEKNGFEKKRATTVDVNSLTKTYFSGSTSKKENGRLKVTNKNVALEVSIWECSKEYERILKLIGRNRKNLIAAFEALKTQGIQVDSARVKQIVGDLIESAGMRIGEEQFEYIFKFAEKNGEIDYKFMLEIFKERLYLLSAHPKKDVDHV